MKPSAMPISYKPMCHSTPSEPGITHIYASIQWVTIIIATYNYKIFVVSLGISVSLILSRGNNKFTQNIIQNSTTVMINTGLEVNYFVWYIGVPVEHKLEEPKISP